MQGKNKITDIFAGSTDANVLVLTDDANGDALFLDDIFSASPVSVRQAAVWAEIPVQSRVRAAKSAKNRFMESGRFGS